MLLIGILILLLLAVLLISHYCYKRCFYSRKDNGKDAYAPLHGKQYEAVKDEIYACIKRMDEEDFEPVSIKSFDGLTLAGRYYHVKDGAPIKLMFHGYRSALLRDCGGGYYLARKMGMNVLAVDQRSHGASEGRTISFGINERRDCLSWVSYINRRFGEKTPIVLSGLSMGAATVLMATSLTLPKNVVCVVADCPYESPAQIIRKVCADEKLPASLAYPFVRLSAWLFGGFDLEESSALTSVPDSQIPILLIHGEDDRLVPCEMSRRIFAAAQDKTTLETFPHAGHGLCYMTDPERYEGIIYQFLKRVPALSEQLSDPTIRN